MSQLTKKQIEVIKAAAQACESSQCTGLALNLKREFPDAFPFSIEDYINQIGNTCYGYDVLYNDSHIFIPLPNGNRDWSFRAFRLAEKYCTSAPNNVSMYPIHGTTEQSAIYRARVNNIINDDSNYLVISYCIHY
jgi:hypothetical protein